MDNVPSSGPSPCLNRMRNTTLVFQITGDIRLRRTARALVFLVSEETAATNDAGNLRGNHLVPGFVAFGDALEAVPSKDRQIFGIVVVELHETAATDQITVERL